MTQERVVKGVVLPAGHTGSSLFHEVLSEAVTQFPTALAGVRFPAQAGAFKREYGFALARFEAARAAAPERAEIARFIVRRTQEALQFAEPTGRTPLLEYLRAPAKAPQLVQTRLSGAPGLPLEVPFEGKLLRGRELLALGDRLLETQQLTVAARAALGWIVDHVLQQGGKLDLRGQRFVLLGAGAELAPTRLLLRAGANVLWVDLADPALALSNEPQLAGSYWRAREASNLLESPREIARCIAQFAAEGPLHVGMFAYAGGASQEWRLGAAMHAITSSLDPALVRSVALLVSPTTPSVLQPESVRAAAQRLRAAPAWQRALAAARLVRKPGHHDEHGLQVALATVSIQGLSYQAAQYIAKIAAAESYAAFGTDLSGASGRPVTVSANVAGITRTRSLSHPLFEAAFAGAHHFGVRIFDAATTRALSGLLILHDLLNPAAPGAAEQGADSARARVARLHSQQVHGGIYGLPFVLEGVIRAAAVAGLARQPGLLLRKPGQAGGPAPQLDGEPASAALDAQERGRQRDARADQRAEPPGE